jgi:hypothetical protein
MANSCVSSSNYCYYYCYYYYCYDDDYCCYCYCCYYCCYYYYYYCCYYYCKLAPLKTAQCFLKLQGDQTVRSQVPALAVVKPSTARKVLIRLSLVLCLFCCVWIPCRDCGVYSFLATSYSVLLCQAKDMFGRYAGTIYSSPPPSF